MKRDTEATERARAWDEAEAKEKAKISRISSVAGGRDKGEAAERAWAEEEVKKKAEIARVAAQDSEKAKAKAEERARAMVRVRENSAKSAV